jgi:hypothetical protein
MVLAVLDGLRRVTAYILRRLRNGGRVAAFEEACHGRLPARGPQAARSRRTGEGYAKLLGVLGAPTDARVAMERPAITGSKRAASKNKRRVSGFTDEAVRALATYPGPEMSKRSIMWSSGRAVS